MSSLLLPRRFYSQPQGVVQLRPEGSRNLLMMYPLNSAYKDTGLAGPPLTIINATPTTFDAGSGYYLNGSSSYIQSTDYEYKPEITLCVTVNAWSLDANIRAVVSKRNTNGGTVGNNEYQLTVSSTKFTFVAWSDNVTTCLTLNSSTVPVVGKTYNVVIKTGGPSKTASMYINGIRDATATQTANNVQNTTSVVQLGIYQGADSVRWLKGRVTNFALWSDYIGDAQSLSANPWQIFKVSE